MYIAWTSDREGHLQGQMQVTFIDQNDPTKLTNHNVGFTGTRDGNEISIAFPMLSAFGGSTWTGQVSPGSLILSYPEQGGGMGQMTLKYGSTADFQQAASKLRKTVAATQAQRARALAEAQRSRELVSAASSTAEEIRSTEASLNGAIGALQRQFRNPPPTINTPNSYLYKYNQLEIAVVQAWNKEQEDAQVVPFTCYQKSKVAYDASQVAYILSEFSYLDNQWENIRQQTRSALGVIRGSVSRLENLYPTYAQQLQQMCANNGAAPCSPYVWQERLANWQSNARAEVNYVNKRLADDVSLFGGYSARARALNQKANSFPDRLHCSG